MTMLTTDRRRLPLQTGATLTLADFITEEMLLLGAGSTVMYQLAMKPVGLGVAEHSTTLTRPVDRLRTTLSYVYVMVLGEEAERREVARLVNRMHVSVRSPGRYSAYDKDLQLWVAATLARNGETLYERVFGPMDPDSRERVYRDSWILGTALQVDESMWPPTRAEFDDYWQESLTRFEPDPQVQCYVKALLAADNSPAWLRLSLPLQSLMALGNLDPRTREILALPWSERDQRHYDRFWSAFVPAYRATPRVVRQAQARLVLADLRRRLRHGRHVI